MLINITYLIDKWHWYTDLIDSNLVEWNSLLPANQENRGTGSCVYQLDSGKFRYFCKYSADSWISLKYKKKHMP